MDEIIFNHKYNHLYNDICSIYPNQNANVSNLYYIKVDFTLFFSFEQT